MKVRTLVACAAFAAALPLSPAWAAANATTLGGPQGTGYYGAVDPLDYERYGMIPPEQRAQEYTAEAQRARRDSYSGPSWATNPPTPAP